MIRTCTVVVALFCLMFAGLPVLAQDGGAIRGRVTFDGTDTPVHGAMILVIGLGRSVTTDDDGRFEVRGAPAGQYEVLAQREHFSTARQPVTVGAGATVDLTFKLTLEPIHEDVTVTAGPTGESTAFEAFNSIQSLDSFDIAKSAAPTLASLVQRVPGVDIRSFGPGSERPIIRGFDGDRVLVLQDGIRTGDLSSQSGDHGVTLDPGALDRVEVVRGPATLLYGSNAIGGVVHALTPQEAFRRTPFTGLRGQFLSDAGSGNGQAASNGNVQYGQGNWMFWAGGGSRRTGDYQTPLGTIDNSAARLSNGRGGIGYTGNKGFFSAGYETERGRYGVPFAGAFHAHGHEDDHKDDHKDDHDEDDHADDLEVDLEPRRQNIRFDAGLRELTNPVASSVRLIVSHLDWRHDEVEIEDGQETLGTRFTNKTTSVRAEVEQRPTGRLSGRFGASGEFRNYLATGEEALAPETSQQSLGLFAYEQLDFGRARLMFGGRVERTAYDTEEREGHHEDDGHGHKEDELLAPATRDRAFTGGSGSVGLHVDVAQGTALVSTLTRSYRAPALEELYNFGPHVGNLAFEIGSADLNREASVGFDVSLRHRSARARGEINAFVYNINDFVFPGARSEVSASDLFVIEYQQGNSRFSGVDGQVSLGLHDHLWVNASLGYVRATLTEMNASVPRIPPLHGRLSLDMPFNSFTLSPEVVWASRQDRLFVNETETAGYALFNVNASYVLGRGHHAHIFSLSGLNLTNELYRRHTSLIKALAPELGRAVRVSYAVRFF
jgi:iron complex outermembrane receptor protein